MSRDPDWVRYAMWAAKPYCMGRTDADDIRQEALLRACQSVRRVEAAGMGRLTVNRAAVLGARWGASEYIRTSPGGCRYHGPPVLALEELTQEPVHDPQLADVIAEAEWRQTIRPLAREALNDEQWDIIDRLYWQGQTSPQIAAVRGCSVQRIWRMAALARARLKEALNAQSS